MRAEGADDSSDNPAGKVAGRQPHACADAATNHRFGNLRFGDRPESLREATGRDAAKVAASGARESTVTGELRLDPLPTTLEATAFAPTAAVPPSAGEMNLAMPLVAAGPTAPSPITPPS